MTDSPDDKHYCPICQSLMVENHRTYSPRMNDSTPRYLQFRWTCANEDGKGGSHWVEIKRKAP